MKCSAWLRPTLTLARFFVALRRRLHHFVVEARDAFGGALRHVEVDVDQAELGAAEFRRRRVAAHAVAPRAGGLDRAVLLPPGELGLHLGHDALHFLAGVLEALLQLVQARHHEAGGAAQHLGLGGAAARQVHLGAAEVDPHVLQAGEDVRVARAAQADDVEQRRQALVVDDHVEVLEVDDVAHHLGVAVVLLELLGGVHGVSLIPTRVWRNRGSRRRCAAPPLPRSSARSSAVGGGVSGTVAGASILEAGLGADVARPRACFPAESRLASARRTAPCR